VVLTYGAYRVLLRTWDWADRVTAKPIGTQMPASATKTTGLGEVVAALGRIELELQAIHARLIALENRGTLSEDAPEADAWSARTLPPDRLKPEAVRTQSKASEPSPGDRR